MHFKKQQKTTRGSHVPLAFIEAYFKETFIENMNTTKSAFVRTV